MSAAHGIMVAYIRRLVDYGKGEPDPLFDVMTIGEIADEIIARLAREQDQEEE